MNTTVPELELPLNAIPHAISDEEIAQVVEFLAGRGWTTAQEILPELDGGGTETKKRRLRRIAAQSGGRIAGGQEGYRLVCEMTAAEHNHFRNWMVSQAREMQRRIVEADHVFYARQPVEVRS